MNREDVRARFAYNHWANRRVVDAASGLSPARYTEDLNASFGSVRGTLVHILWAESWWLQVWQERTPPPAFEARMFPDVAALAAHWAELEREQDAFVASLSDALLEGRRSVKGFEYALAELIHHLLNHSTYHRGQVALLLRQLGARPPATDFRLFLTESRFGATY